MSAIVLAFSSNLGLPHTQLLLAGNDTVPISMCCCGGRMRSTDCPLVQPVTVA